MWFLASQPTDMIHIILRISHFSSSQASSWSITMAAISPLLVSRITKYAYLYKSNHNRWNYPAHSFLRLQIHKTTNYVYQTRSGGTDVLLEICALSPSRKAFVSLLSKIIESKPYLAGKI